MSCITNAAPGPDRRGRSTGDGRVDDADRFVRETGGDLVLDLGRAAGVSPVGAETLRVENITELGGEDFLFTPFNEAMA